MARAEIVPPRIVSAPVAFGSARYRPWYEVSALFQVAVVAWQWRDTVWRNWACPARSGRPDLDAVRIFDPGRRAAWPGTPVQEPVPELDVATASELAGTLVGRLQRELYRQPQLGLVSNLGDDRETFRRRCLSALRPALRGGGLREDRGAATMEAVRTAIEERTLDDGELIVKALRVGLGWYPQGIEPSVSMPSLLVTGPARSGAAGESAHSE